MSEPSIPTDAIPTDATASTLAPGTRDARHLTLRSWRAWQRWLLLVALLIGAGWVAVTSGVRPVQQTCDPALATDICLGSIDAALRRGLSPVHPLLLAAHAEPGPAGRPDQFGHRATVTFRMLGVGQPTSVRLFFDAGGHWGGSASVGGEELALWALLQGLVMTGGAAAGLLLVARLVRARRFPAIGAGPRLS